MPEVRMLKNTRWLKKEQTLKKGDVLTIDQATASRWVFLHIAEYPSDGGQNIADTYFTEDQLKAMTVADLMNIADQNQIPLKPGTPKNMIIRKINQFFNPTVPDPIKPKALPVEETKPLNDFTDLEVDTEEKEELKKEDYSGYFNS